METSAAADALASLGSEPRLRIFKSLSGFGPDGVAAGELARLVGMPANTLSFHLKELASTGLVCSRREGRSMIYSIKIKGVGELLRFLSVDCCMGNPESCLPVSICLGDDEEACSIKKQNVLFVCSHNAARSQMAEGLLRKRFGNHFAAFSAGLEPREVDPKAIQVMEEAGIDISHQVTKSLDDIMRLISVSHVIFVCQTEEDYCPKLYPFAEQHWRWVIEAPSTRGQVSPEEELDRFRRVRDALNDEIGEWANMVLSGNQEPVKAG
ncbi:MAG: helix-turn-helix domain-containing protein [Verrucomicrobiales bacterium]|nr:helix-turn-helix domain-containing protein [Verrucomicrobiales bacterium]